MEILKVLKIIYCLMHTINNNIAEGNIIVGSFRWCSGKNDQQYSNKIFTVPAIYNQRQKLF